MIEAITSIKNFNEFKKSIFKGKIFKFHNSEFAFKIISEIKKEIKNYYDKDLSFIHTEENAEIISKDLIKILKNNKLFLKIFKNFLKEINFNIDDCHRDKFVVRISPAEFKRANYEASRIGIHRDTWGTNIFEQINWWAPINNIDISNTLIFYPEYFNKPIINTTDNWDLDTYLTRRKLGKFNYPSAPKLKEDLQKNTRVFPINIKPGEVLCFSGSHLHRSSKEDSKITRFSYEIRTVSTSDIENKIKAPNVDCELKKQYPKIFKHFYSNETLKISR